ncbi:MAG: hypothetical protein J7J36_01310 [Thermoplasmata archaeon]|nr:hypothetical protein [Thermoplasmata archaeon]
MRHRFIREWAKDFIKANVIEKLILLLPFIVLIIDAEIFYYSLTRGEETIIIASSFVLLLSIMEIIAVSKEIVSYINKTKREADIEKEIIKIIEEMDNPNVKKVVNKFMEMNKGYSMQEVYPVACKIIDALKK